MASSDSGKELILYHYSYSPYARRVIWYLTLRGIPYLQCVQPPILPRPDVASLGIFYRRIPLLAIDGDVLLDTRLMLTELEALFPELPRLGTTPDSAPELRALERLLSTFTTETSLFSTAASLLPTDILSSAWFRDRAHDPVAVREGLKAGDRVVVWPTDTGSTHKDAGTLVALDRTKVVFTVEGQQGAKTRVHAPRHGFKVKKVKAEGHAGAKL
ncbi:putative transporter [Verticillium dahliae VDG2]|nr:putative transporter [Verticillium dahliae VDG2]